MILLLSKSSHEIATEKVASYLNKYKANCIRINGADLLEPGSVFSRIGESFHLRNDRIPFKTNSKLD